MPKAKNNKKFWRELSEMRERSPLYNPEEIIEMKNEGREKKERLLMNLISPKNSNSKHH